MAWDTSTRRSRLPADWPTICRQIRRRDPVCRCTGCKHHPDPCTGPTTEVDHIHRGDDHRLENLQGLCTRCHAAKTARENAIYQRNLAALRRRPPERHPGVKP